METKKETIAVLAVDDPLVVVRTGELVTVGAGLPIGDSERVVLSLTVGQLPQIREALRELESVAGIDPECVEEITRVELTRKIDGLSELYGSVAKQRDELTEELHDAAKDLDDARETIEDLSAKLDELERVRSAQDKLVAMQKRRLATRLTEIAGQDATIGERDAMIGRLTRERDRQQKIADGLAKKLSETDSEKKLALTLNDRLGRDNDLLREQIVELQKIIAEAREIVSTDDELPEEPFWSQDVSDDECPPSEGES